MNSEEHEQQLLKVTNMLLKKYGGAYEDNQLFKQNYGWPLGAKLNLSQDRSFDQLRVLMIAGTENRRKALKR